jgi:hypothetical protein
MPSASKGAFNSAEQGGQMTDAGIRPVEPHIAVILAEREKDHRSHRRVLAFMLLWVIAVTATMVLTKFPVGALEHTVPGYKADGGYTKSLLLVILPLAFLAVWYRRSRVELDLQPIMKAVLQVIALVTVAWVVLDMLFANLFFTFPVESSRVYPWLTIYGYSWEGQTCGSLSGLFNLSCWKRNIPVEELVFYLGSAAVLNFLYMWGAEDCYSLYSLPRDAYKKKASETGRLFSFDKKILLVGLLIFVVAVIIKRAGWGHSNPEGFPFYFLAQMAIVLVPLSAFSRQVRLFTNPRASLFVAAVTVLISVIWEATLALRYGWWNYQMTSMVGPTVGPWSNLPIEAWILWVSVTWGVMVNYEVAKIKGVSGKTWREALFGRKPSR